jgi:hypothetical protein
LGVRRLPAALALTIALGLTACGGANDPAGEPPTTAPPEPADTRPASPEAKSFPADFVKKVDPVCVETLDQVDKLAGNEVKDRATLQKIAKTYGDAATELEAQKPPEKNATQYKRFTEAFHDGSDLFSDLDVEVGHGDTGAYQRVPATIDQVGTEVKDLAMQFGFTQCAGS